MVLVKKKDCVGHSALMFKMPLSVKTAIRTGLIIAPLTGLRFVNYDAQLLYAASAMAALHNRLGEKGARGMSVHRKLCQLLCHE